MRKTNTTLDREPLSSETIRERQNFNYVLKETAASRIPLWKSAWFYGPVGIAMVTMVVSAVRMNPKNDEYDSKTTLAQNELIASVAFPITSFTNDKVEKVSINRPEVEQTKKITVDKVVNVEKVRPLKIEETIELKPEIVTEEKNTPNLKTIVSEPEIVTRKNTMPDIAGVFTGRISASAICSAGMIHCNNDFEVISYEIQYDNGRGVTIDRISGNKIPDYICSSIQRYNIGSPVFITKIIAQNPEGIRKQLLSMSLEPTF